MGAAQIQVKGGTVAAVGVPVRLKLEPRDGSGQQARALRREGRLPAIVYGHGVDSVSVVVGGRDFLRAVQQVGGNKLLALQSGDEPGRKALLRARHSNPADAETRRGGS